MTAKNGRLSESRQSLLSLQLTRESEALWFKEFFFFEKFETIFKDRASNLPKYSRGLIHLLQKYTYFGSARSKLLEISSKNIWVSVKIQPPWCPWHCLYAGIAQIFPVLAHDDLTPTERASCNGMHSGEIDLPDIRKTWDNPSRRWIFGIFLVTSPPESVLFLSYHD